MHDDTVTCSVKHTKRCTSHVCKRLKNLPEYTLQDKRGSSVAPGLMKAFETSVRVELNLRFVPIWVGPGVQAHLPLIIFQFLF